MWNLFQVAVNGLDQIKSDIETSVVAWSGDPQGTVSASSDLAFTFVII